MCKGWIHSLQSLGAVDGPGLRYVIFMQGCPYRCVYCHNPDTWAFEKGEPAYAEELAEKAARMKPYFGKNGGVTVTGGEPLAQSAFVTALFKALHERDIHTALDTSGAWPLKEAAQVLEHTDLVLADIKFLTAQDYQQYCGADFLWIQAFLEQVQKKNIPLWVRHVVVPGLTDTEGHIRKLVQTAARYPNLKKIELLPFRKLCVEKYHAAQIPFLLEDTPEMDGESCRALQMLADSILKEEGKILSK